MTMRAVLMDHAVDPRLEIIDASAQWVGGIHPLGARLLVGVYVRPEKTKSGIILANKTRDEDHYQGKVGLILKMGPLAFQSDENHTFTDPVPKVGDWVMFRVGDTMPWVLNDRPYRWVEDVMVQAIVDRPDAVM